MPPLQTNATFKGPKIEELERVVAQVGGIALLPEVKEHTSSYMQYIEKYNAKGINLEQVYNQLRQSRKKEQIKDNFLQSKDHGPMAQFLELMPLLANKPGRLGQVIGARVTKTAKPDDEGNSAVDHVVELTNEFLKTEKAKIDKRFQDMKLSTTVFVDVTSNPAAAVEREGILKDMYLNRGKKANVKCYEKFPGVLGYDAPKVVILKQEDYLTTLSGQLQSCLQNVPGRGYMITDEKQFQVVYREFFQSFLDSIREAAANSIEHLNGLQVALSPEQKVLKAAYQDVVNFINNLALCEEEYKKAQSIVTEE